MADVVLFKPEKAEEYKNVTDVHIKDGVLTFYYQPHSGMTKGIKIQTTVPFTVEEEIGG
jgi:hypothetical protein